MNLLFVQRHYLPDVPTYCELTHELARFMAARGHSVHVVSGPPSYQKAYDGPPPPRAEVMDGVVVNRMRTNRLLNGLTGFSFAAVFVVWRRRKQFDAIVVSSEPPILLPAATALAAPRVPKVQILQDIHPEAGQVGGMIRSRVIIRVLLTIDRWVARRVDCTVVLSGDMADTYRASRQPRRLEVINNFRLGTPSAPGSGGLLRDEDFNVTFVGNIGRFQNIDLLLDAAALLPEDAHITLHLVGSGSELESVRRRVASEDLTNVRVHGRLGREDAQGFMERSDLGIISLAPEIYRYSYPSKTMSYLDARCPILAVVESDSSLAADVCRVGGLVAEPSAEGVAGAMIEAAGRERPELSNDLPFDKQATLRRWLDLISEIGRSDAD